MVDRLTCSPLLRPEGLTLAFSVEGALKKLRPGDHKGCRGFY